MARPNGLSGRSFGTNVPFVDNQKQLEHCGLCEDLPCKMFLELRDPNMSDEEFHESLKARQEALRRRTEIATEKWIMEVSSS
jgi:hypothetical protein